MFIFYVIVSVLSSYLIYNTVTFINDIKSTSEKLETTTGELFKNGEKIIEVLDRVGKLNLQ